MSSFKSATKMLLGAICATAFTVGTASAETITLRGASMFDENHTFTKTFRKFEELVQEYYDGDVEFDLRLNSELGVEKDYVTFLQQGVAIDYTILAPSNMAILAPSVPIMDMPFLFRDQEHWESVLSSNTLTSLEGELMEKADIKIIGYTGGGVRNLVSDKPIANMEDLKGHKMRVMGAPIQAQVFNAFDASPAAIAYNEVYNAIQTGVISGLENEAAGVENLKFYEVAPYISLTQHTITVRPIVMSGKTFRKLPDDLKEAVLKAGQEAAAFGRELETSQDSVILEKLAEAGHIELVEFEDRDKLLELVVPVQDAYAEEIGATDLLKAIREK